MSTASLPGFQTVPASDDGIFALVLKVHLDKNLNTSISVNLAVVAHSSVVT